jgi:GAF domain-containing protein
LPLNPAPARGGGRAILDRMSTTAPALGPAPAFVLALCDALRPLTDPDAVRAVARERLAEHLGAEVSWVAPGRGAPDAGEEERLLVPVGDALLAARRAVPFAPAEVAVAEAAAERIAVLVERAAVVAAAADAGERIEVALDAARIGTFVWDPVADRTQADDRLLALLAGHPRTDLSVAQLLERVVHPADRDAFVAAVAAGIDPAGPGRMDHVVRLAAEDAVSHLRLTWRAEFAGSGLGRRAVRVVGAAVDVSEQEHAREDLRRAAARDAFRLALTDALSATDDPAEMEREALALLVEALGAGRGLVAELGPDGETVTVPRDVCAGLASIAGTHRLDDFGAPVAAALRAGRPLVVGDVDALGLVPAERAAFARLGVGALAMTAPVRDDAGTTYVAVHDPAPHRWTSDELALLDEVAERLRSAVQRARAEAALHETGTRLQVAQDATRVGFASWDPIAGRVQLDERAEAVLGDLGGSPLWASLERVIHPEDRGLLAAAVRGAGEPGGDGRYHQVVRVTRPGAPLRWVAVTGQYLPHGGAGGGRPRRVVATLTDVTDRVLAEQALARATAHDRYLLALTDALRPLGDPVAVQRAAAGTLGHELRASRVVYAEVAEERWARVRAEHRAPGRSSLLGRHRLGDHGTWITVDLRADHTVVIADVLTDPRVTPAEAAALLDREVRAAVAVPLVKDGALVALLALHQAEPRVWTADEVALAEDTAERTWAAVERARAQTALQARARPRRRG